MHYLVLAKKEENWSFAVGHLAIGYILGKGSAKLLKTNINIPTILTLSIIMDADILADRLDIPFLNHRGPMHSIIVILIVFLPIFAVYRKRAVPYFVALTQHSWLGDFLTGGTQLLWPLTTHLYGIGMSIFNPVNITIEWVTFALFVIILVKTKDLMKLLQPHTSSVLLAIPTFTVLLPPLLSFPLHVPASLILPHLFYAVFFTASILVAVTRHEFSIMKTSSLPKPDDHAAVQCFMQNLK